jgi:hypothetical protein
MEADDDASPGSPFCFIDGQPHRTIRTVHKQVRICQVCSLGEPVLGTFDAVMQVDDGRECRLAGEFRAFRTH